jgi:hypothetical protein
VVGAGAQDAVDDRRHAHRFGSAVRIAPKGVVVGLPVALQRRVVAEGLDEIPVGVLGGAVGSEKIVEAGRLRSSR